MIQGGDYSEHKLELDLTVEATTTLTISGHRYRLSYA